MHYYHGGYHETITFPRETGGGSGNTTWLDPVSTITDLSTVGTPSTTPVPVDGEARVVLDTNTVYVYDAALDVWNPIGGSVAPLHLGPTPPGGVTNGYLWASSTNSQLYQYDAVRTKWLGLNERKLIMGKRTNTTNSYVFTMDSIASNTNPELLEATHIGEEWTLVSILASNEAGVTAHGGWTAEIQDDTATIIGSLVVANGTDLSVSTTLNIDITAGTRIQMYVTGTGIPRPTIIGIFRRKGA